MVEVVESGRWRLSYTIYFAFDRAGPGSSPKKCMSQVYVHFLLCVTQDDIQVALLLLSLINLIRGAATVVYLTLYGACVCRNTAR